MVNPQLQEVLVDGDQGSVCVGVGDPFAGFLRVSPDVDVVGLASGIAIPTDRFRDPVHQVLVTTVLPCGWQ